MDSAIQVRDRETSVGLEQAYASWNATSTVYQSDTCIRQLFERWAERTPASPALVCGDRRLSYGELNSKANRLAHYMKSFGRGAGQPGWRLPASFPRAHRCHSWHAEGGRGVCPPRPGVP